jgi:hypothetical protein
VEGAGIRQRGGILKLYHKDLTRQVANQQAIMLAFYSIILQALSSGQVRVLTHHLLHKSANRQVQGTSKSTPHESEMLWASDQWSQAILSGLHTDLYCSLEYVIIHHALEHDEQVTNGM